MTNINRQPQIIRTTCDEIAGLIVKRLDGKVFDGLVFAGISIKGIEKIILADSNARYRLNRKGNYKRILEEIFPITRYILSKYSLAMQMKVEWKNGNQPYDAIIYCRGQRVNDGIINNKSYLEVTTIQHKNDYLVREELLEKGISNGPIEICRDPKTKEVISEITVQNGYDWIDELIEVLIDGYRKKEAKKYASNTILIIACYPMQPFAQDEWEHFIKNIKSRIFPSTFEIVYIYESYNERWIEIFRKN